MSNCVMYKVVIGRRSDGLKLYKRTPSAARIYEVWVGAESATANECRREPKKIGEAHADDFHAACIAVAKEYNKADGKENPLVYGPHLDGTYGWSVWGIGVYDNYEDANRRDGPPREYPGGTCECFGGAEVEASKEAE